MRSQDYLQNKRSGKEGYAAIKFDMSKAYAQVEWNFLRRRMLKLGFHVNWVNLVMNCVSTVSYRVKDNGEYTHTIFPHRGLRQGDPLSPYLFVIYAESFSSALREKESLGRIQGIRVCM